MDGTTPITDPENATFVNYINSREFDSAIQGDVSPEGLCFIPEADSKNGDSILLAACEVSGTMAAYRCEYTPSDRPVPPVTYGDVNGDGNINLLDLIALRKYLAKWNVSLGLQNTAQ